jgi:hypothetical protein
MASITRSGYAAENGEANPVADVAALYSQDGVWATHDGTFHGRQAIEKGYAQLDFKSWQIGNYSPRSIG